MPRQNDFANRAAWPHTGEWSAGPCSVAGMAPPVIRLGLDWKNKRCCSAIMTKGTLAMILVMLN